MSPLKIAVIGAGSSYTPEIIEEIQRRRDRFPAAQITLMDIDPERLEIMLGFCRRFATHLGCDIRIEATADRREALLGARFVLTQIRVGGNAQRILDEKIPLKYDVIGQETTGPGGMFKALRTIPPMVEIARDMEEICPEAWMINYANPTGMIAEAVANHTNITIAGLCAGGNFPRDHAVEALDVAPEDVSYNYFGLNHLNFGYNLRIKGIPLTDEAYDKVLAVATWGSVAPELIRMLRLVPSPYLPYYFHRDRTVKDAREKPLSRGEQVQLVEKEVFDAYANPSQVTKPEALNKRGGGGYSEIALDVMEAAYNNQDKVIVINTPNQGAVPHLPDDAVIEVPCLVNASGISPLHQPDIPKTVWGLVAAVKNYEQLTVEAALSGSRESALLALLAHPLVGDYEKSATLLDEMLEANQKFLPQFRGIMNIVIGVDQGGSGTRAVVCTLDGTLLSSGFGPGACHPFDGMEAAMDATKTAVENALKNTSIPSMKPLGFAGGYTGADWPDEYILLQEAVKDLGYTNSVYIVNDCIIALRGGTAQSYGAILVAGSGANCAVRAPDGREFIYHYYHDSDLQGGSALGQAALNAIYRAETGRPPQTSLRERVLALFKLPDVDALMRAMVEGRLPEGSIQEIAPLVFEEAERGDQAAANIITHFGVGCAELLVNGIQRLGMSGLEVEIVLSGGVFKAKSPMLRRILVKEVIADAPGAKFIEARYEPVVGAALLALENTGVQPGPVVQSNLEESARKHALLRL